MRSSLGLIPLLALAIWQGPTVWPVMLLVTLPLFGMWLLGNILATRRLKKAETGFTPPTERQSGAQKGPSHRVPADPAPKRIAHKPFFLWRKTYSGLLMRAGVYGAAYLLGIFYLDEKNWHFLLVLGVPIFLAWFASDWFYTRKVIRMQTRLEKPSPPKHN